MHAFNHIQNNKFNADPATLPFYYLGFKCCPSGASNLRSMSELNIADLLALDTGALKSRLSELRRYL